MNTTRMAGILAVTGLAALFGGMLFFAAIMAPLVFTKLPPTIANPFIRATFPRYYAYVTIAAALSALVLLIRGNPRRATIAALIAVTTFWLWLVWLPHLNTLRTTGHPAAFARGHAIAVWINATQLLATLYLLIRTAIPPRTNP